MKCHNRAVVASFAAHGEYYDDMIHSMALRIVEISKVRECSVDAAAAYYLAVLEKHSKRHSERCGWYFKIKKARALIGDMPCI